MYTRQNFPTKAALKRAVAAGNHVEIFAPGLGVPATDGEETLEGPHAPAPHTWWARVIMKDGSVVKVIS